MALTPAVLEAAALAATGMISHCALANANPDPASGVGTEITASGRQAITWTAGGSDGTVDGANVSFSLAASTAAPYLQYWSASSGGIYRGSKQINIPSGAARTVTVDPTMIATSI